MRRKYKQSHKYSIRLLCPTRSPMREKFLRMRRLMKKEVLENKERSHGPISMNQIIIEMAEQRYANEIHFEKMDKKRVLEDRGLKEPIIAPDYF